MSRLTRYKQNLSIVYTDEGTFVRSYDTLVAKFDGSDLIQLGWWSVTTQKHINYVAQVYGLNLIRGDH